MVNVEEDTFVVEEVVGNGVELIHIEIESFRGVDKGC